MKVILSLLFFLILYGGIKLRLSELLRWSCRLLKVPYFMMPLTFQWRQKSYVTTIFRYWQFWNDTSFFFKVWNLFLLQLWLLLFDGFLRKFYVKSYFPRTESYKNNVSQTLKRLSTPQCVSATVVQAGVLMFDQHILWMSLYLIVITTLKCERSLL